MEASEQRYREVMGRFATGVTVVTARGTDGPVGMTTNAVTSLSLRPLQLLVSFDNTARTLPVVRETGRFAVNVLSAGQEDLAALFASKIPPPEKFATVSHADASEVPILDGALAWLVCDLAQTIPAGDHTIGIGAVLEMGERAGEPLLFYGGAYRGLG